MYIPASEIQLNRPIGYVTDTGVANAYVATITPAVYSLVTGISIDCKILASSTSATPTLNVSGFGAITIIRNDTGGALNSGDIQANSIHRFLYDGTNWRILNPKGIAASTIQLNVGIGYVADTGVVNAYVATVSPPVSLTIGVSIDVKISATNTNTIPTLNANSTGVITIVRNDTGGAVNVGDLQANEVYRFLYDGTNWRLLNPNYQLASLLRLNSGIGYIADSGAVNAYVATVSPAIALTTGVSIDVKISATNTSTTPTLNANSTGVITIVRNDTGGAVNVGDLHVNDVHRFLYDGTNWRLINPYYSTQIASSVTITTPTIVNPILSGSGWPSFSVNKGGAAQSITQTTWTKVTWPTEVFDTNNNFASDTFTPTVAGKYLITANIYLSALVAGKILQAGFYKNGVAAHIGAYIYQSTTGDLAVNVSAVVDANGSTDYFDVYVYHDDTTARSISGTAINTYFTGCRIG